MGDEFVKKEEKSLYRQDMKITQSLKERAIKEKRSDNVFLLWIAILITFMLTVLVLSTYVYVNVHVEGSSMQPTLYTNDFLVANKYKKIKHGSIIVIKDEMPDSDEWLIKRVIAMEGDKVEIKNGSVYVNGKMLDEPYAKGKTDCFFWIGEKIIGKDEFFYLGDNREYSSDSRSLGYGTCKKKQIVGVVTDWSLYFNKVFGK